MNINEFSDFTTTTNCPALNRQPADFDLAEVFITVTGLSGELGEVMEHIKKHVRDGRPLDVDAVTKEMGDLLFYWARLCKQLGLLPSDIIAASVQKITGRLERGTQRGSGDNR